MERKNAWNGYETEELKKAQRNLRRIRQVP